MGWGRWGYGWGRSYQPGKKAQAASLSTATLQRIIAQQKAEEEATARYYAQARLRQEEAAKKAAEEARLELAHGGKEALAKWREENAERLQAERIAKLEAERKAAGEKAIVDEMAELNVELAQLNDDGAGGKAGSSGNTSFRLNKAQTKQHFHLTDRDLQIYLPAPVVVQKEGAKRPSSITWASTDIFNAVTRKEGKKKLRLYQAAYNPALAKRFIWEELMLLHEKHPSLEEQGRQAAVVLLCAADDAAIAEAAKASQQVEAAIRALQAAREKQRRARASLGKVATQAEIENMGLAEIPNEEEEEEGCHSTHPAKRPTSSRTPITAGGPSSKKQRVEGAAFASSAGAGMSALDVD
jgi:hypothetical protein